MSMAAVSSSSPAMPVPVVGSRVPRGTLGEIGVGETPIGVGETGVGVVGPTGGGGATTRVRVVHKMVTERSAGQFERADGAYTTLSSHPDPVAELSTRTV